MQISKKETKKEVGHGLDPSSTLVTKSKNQKIGEVLEKKREEEIDRFVVCGYCLWVLGQMSVEIFFDFLLFATDLEMVIKFRSLLQMGGPT